MNKEVLMRVHTVAKKTGITVRTLHYYDEIGLLIPTNVSETKYRLYSKQDLDRLQQILFFKEVGFNLKEIKEIISASSYSKKEALENHIKILKEKQKRIEGIIQVIEESLEGKEELKFSIFDETKLFTMQKKYHQEVIDRWGETAAFGQFETKWKENKNLVTNMEEASKSIFSEIFLYSKQSPSSKKVQELIETWRNYITENFYDCTISIFQGLGKMYVLDERFTNTINSYGDEHLAEFVSKAIEIYCDKKRKEEEIN